jgi:hypothetical protein
VAVHKGFRTLDTVPHCGTISGDAGWVFPNEQVSRRRRGFVGRRIDPFILVAAFP